MTNAVQNFDRRLAVDRHRPADEVGTEAEEDVDLPAAARARLEPAVHRPAGGGARQERRRGGLQGASFAGAEPRRFSTALRVGVGASGEDVLVQKRPDRRTPRELDGPQRSADALQILGLADLLVPQEFGPGAIGGVGKVMGRTLPVAVPAARRLRITFPEKWKARIRVPKDDHVAAEAPRDRASSLTRRTCGLSGSHSPRRRSEGLQPSRKVRGRSNQRRMPISL